MNPLLRHIAPGLIDAQDALRIARGGTWEDLWIRTCSPGQWGSDLCYQSNPKAITIEHSPDGPGRVTWAEIADFIRAGLTDEITADLETACTNWGTYNHDPANPGGLTYTSCIAEFRRLERLIVTNALHAPATGQLNLFEAAPC